MEPIILGELPEASYPPTPYAGAPYAPDAIMGSTQIREPQVFAPSFVVAPPAPPAPLPAMMTPIAQQSVAAAPPQLFSSAPPAATPPVVAAPPAPAPTRPAQAPTAASAGTPKLSEIGQISTNLLKARQTGAYEDYARGASEGTALVAGTEAAQAAEMKGLQDRENVLLGHELQAMTARDEAEADQATRRTAANDARTKLDAARTELEGAKIDVDAAYGGTSGRIFSAIAVAMGAFGASMTGGPNYAMQIVDARINRELDAQKSEIEKKKGKVTELGQTLIQNEKLLGDADQARNLTRAQSYTALLASTEAKINIDRATPQQMLVLDALKSKVKESLSGLYQGVKTAEANVSMVAAQERQAQRQANAAAAATRIKKDEERREKALDREAKFTEIALKGEADRQNENIKTGNVPTTSGVTPQSMTKVIDELGKPSVGVKDLAGVIGKLDTFQAALNAYGSAADAPGGSTAGVASSWTPSLTGKARELDRARTLSTLNFRHDLTGAAASESEDKKILLAAGGEDPKMNQIWINQQRKEIEARVNLALNVVPEGQRAAARAELFGGKIPMPASLKPSVGK